MWRCVAVSEELKVIECECSIYILYRCCILVAIGFIHSFEYYIYISEADRNE